jgi:hypothetical protein
VLGVLSSSVWYTFEERKREVKDFKRKGSDRSELKIIIRK